jgi:hypothetical protein
MMEEYGGGQGHPGREVKYQTLKIAHNSNKTSRAPA